MSVAEITPVQTFGKVATALDVVGDGALPTVNSSHQAE